MILACTMACLSVFANDTINLRETSPEDVKIVKFCDLTENDLEEIMQGLHPDKIIEFLANTTLSGYCLRGDSMHLMQDEGNWDTIEIKQTLYAKCTEEEFLFSFDLTNWKPLLELITDKASVALNTQDGLVSLIVGIETN